MDLVRLLSTFSSFLIACVLGLGLNILFFSPISPDILEFPSPTFPVESNSKLQEVTKLGEGLLVKPEDVAIDKSGILYTATRDGWVKRLHNNGSWENWKFIGGESLLGITTSRNGGIIACDADKGLVKVTDDEVTVIASQYEGGKLRFADDVVEGSDGSLYFSVASTKFGFHDWFLDVLEGKSHGQLLKYDPESNQVSILLDNLGFANGVTLSPLQDYLIICESWRFRCLKYWLKEEMKVKTEVFIDNLPGAPDNINLAPDGTFWISLIQIIPSRLKFVHRSKLLKHLVVAFPGLVNKINGAYKKAMVAKVDTDGKIIKVLDDPTGKVMSFVTSALEFEGHLYLGTLNCDFIGKLPLGII
ncbi:OLC1v1037908C1 [Oldenlandia corymbosa var. corymbosa]|uniref:OLC1v1037908C1 n=1 Tax=Oldenlandia corymbosa var. corymbosa TaxID=529605 RepID=A0AAV1CYI8_OLDCO|nr:OLC1v1037908C1 [Oldenlandia corymbosa var. corymbosa]